MRVSQTVCLVQSQYVPAARACVGLRAAKSQQTTSRGVIAYPRLVHTVRSSLRNHVGFQSFVSRRRIPASNAADLRREPYTEGTMGEHEAGAPTFH